MANQITATLEPRVTVAGLVTYRVGLRGLPGYGRKKKWVKLPSGTTADAAEEAKEKLLEMARAGVLEVDHALSKRRNIRGGPIETVAQYFTRWNHDRKTRVELSSTDLEGYRFEKYVRPHFEGVLMTASRSEVERQLENLVDDLDRRVKSGVGDLKSGKTAVDVFHIVTGMFRDACRCKNRDLVVRRDNPTSNVVGPERGQRPAGTILFPDEFAQLVACETINVRRLRTYALLTYLYLRDGELRLLGKDDIDPKRRTIVISRAWEARLKRVGPPKNGKPRTLRYAESLAPLIDALLEEPTPDNYRGHPIPGGLLLKMPRQVALASGLREDLITAGVTRAALFARSATVKNMTAHDLRASGITWRASRGDNAYEIMNEAGHQRFSETEGYIRLAQTYGKVFGEVFGELPLALCGTAYLVRAASQKMAVNIAKRAPNRATQETENATASGAPEERWVPRSGSQSGSHGALVGSNSCNYSTISVPKEGLEPSTPPKIVGKKRAFRGGLGPTDTENATTNPRGTQRGTGLGPTGRALEARRRRVPQTVLMEARSNRR